MDTVPKLARHTRAGGSKPLHVLVLGDWPAFHDSQRLSCNGTRIGVKTKTISEVSTVASAAGFLVRSACLSVRAEK